MPAPFTRLTAPGVPIDLPNVDTDRVIPARFLRKPQGSADTIPTCSTTCASMPPAPSVPSSC
jgi:hypothetical protein